MRNRKKKKTDSCKNYQSGTQTHHAASKKRERIFPLVKHKRYLTQLPAGIFECLYALSRCIGFTGCPLSAAYSTPAKRKHHWKHTKEKFYTHPFPKAKGTRPLQIETPMGMMSCVCTSFTWRKNVSRLIRPFAICWLLVVTALSASAQIAPPPIAGLKPVKYVFLFIGDGMSLPQRQLGEEFLRKTENRGLIINAMPYQAITTTHAAGDQFVTDSAAAGTAIACGVKTQNGVLGLDANGKRGESVAELALKNGRKVGILTSVTINHATPAAFYAHISSRGDSYDIGLDLIASNFHYFGGGGISGSNNRNAEKYHGDLYTLAQEAGYTVCRTAEQIHALEPGVEKVAAFGSTGDLPYAIDGNKAGLRLADFTKQAIELLDNPEGFFMMVEGGKIDFACHDNDAATAVREIVEFDDAVSVAFDFAKDRPDSDVLIVVTADHETGALTVSAERTSYYLYLNLLSKQKGSRSTLVSRTEKFVRDNKEEATFEKFKPLISEMCGLVFTDEGRWRRGDLNLTKEEMRELENDFAVSKKAILENQSTGKDVVVRKMISLLNSKSGVSWNTGGHSALPVNTSVWGNQAQRFALGIRENTDIAKLLKEAVGRYPLDSPVPAVIQENLSPISVLAP